MKCATPIHRKKWRRLTAVAATVCRGRHTICGTAESVRQSIKSDGPRDLKYSYQVCIMEVATCSAVLTEFVRLLDRQIDKTNTA